MQDLIEKLIVDWELSAKNLREAGGDENFWKADTYAYCAHRLKSVSQPSKCPDGLKDKPCLGSFYLSD